MQNNERILHLDICDYGRRRLCPLYDNLSNVSGQAVNIFVTKERNGWKELTFTLPSVCHTDGGIESNYRLDFLKADYQIRLIDDNETDWFIVSEPKITHNAFSKSFQVTAGHVSQLLKHKNLGLEFSDDKGNNVGTAEQLAETILEGTGWTVGYVYPFAEKDGTPKHRSLKASAKTGAFKLMAMMCDLFDAKPIYHGDDKTVDIVPINPFSEPAPGMPPDIPDGSDVVELHYGKNVSNVTRTLNTENMVTKLYAYGAYGDKTSGYCGIDECKHTEYIYMVTDNCAANQTYYFTFEDAAGISLTYHFTPHVTIPLGSRLTFSLLDPCSMMYIWDGSNQNAYPVTKGTVGTHLPAAVAKEDVQNWFQFVMNFDYYREVGLLTGEMIQIIADYQRSAPYLYQQISDASLAMSDAQTDLSKTIGYIDFCKLDVKDRWPAAVTDYETIILNKETYKDGVIYRTDYDQSEDNRFKWRTTDSLDANGDPINSAAGIVYIIHDTNPVTWDKAYLKSLDDEDDPTALTLWAETGSLNINVNTDQFFLFSYNGINGHLGTLESNDESAVMSLEEAVRVVTVDHPVIFTNDPAPGIMPAEVNGYGWLWQYDARGSKSNFYFAFADEGDTYWQPVYFQDNDPGGAEENSYWFNWRDSVLYRRVNSAWKLLDTSAEQKIASVFATVFMFCKARDRYYQGLYENYVYTVPDGSSLAPGNYFIENEYNSYWAFTTTQTLNSGDALRYNYDDAWITQTKSGVETTLKPKGYRFDNVNYHPSNILSGKGIENGYISENGELSDSTTQCRSQSFISVVPETSYVISGANRELIIHYFDDKQRWLSSEKTSAGFVTPAGCTYIRLCAEVSAESFTNYDDVVICAEYAESTIVIDDLNYIRLSPIDTNGDNIGLISCIDKFTEYADLTYDTCYKALLAAQEALRSLEQQLMLSVGDMYREGWWNDASYVDGDEQKLYEDTLDNLKEISKPEATYNITYLDLYESNADNHDFGVTEETTKVQWPDVSIVSAVHLIDPEIAINTWAFIDKVQKCYDKRWQTKIVINTNLSTIAQHSFTDVMTNIATVASEIKGKTSYYDKTLSSSATNNDITLINAELSKNERELLSAKSKVDEVDGVVTKYQSLIKQTADEISAEVLRATQAEGKIASEAKSLIKQTADEITTQVGETYATKNSVNEVSTSVSQTKNAISSIVSLGTSSDGKNISYTGSKLQQTLDSFSVEITGKDSEGNDVASSLKQTVNGLSSTVNTINSKSILQQTPESILAAVKTQNANAAAGNDFKTSSVSITTSGVAISTDGVFSVAAGDNDESSAVKIDKNGVAIGSTGVFTVQTDNFGVTPDGKISASNAVINGQISNNGYPVLTKNYDLYIGSDAPANAHAGMIWIKPGVPSSGSSGDSSEEVVVPTNQTVTFTGTTDASTRHWFYEEGSANVTLTANSYSVGSKSSYNYNVTIPVYLARRSDGQKHGAKFKVSLNGSVTLTETKTWSSSESASNMTDTVTLSTTSSVWLGDLSHVTAVISISRESTGTYTGNIYLDRNQTVSATCN